MSAVADAIAYLETEIAARAPEYEGLKDYARLNIQPETQAAVQELLRRFDVRMGLLATNRELLQKLHDDPAIDVQSVSAAVDADLADQEATIAAARKLFTAAPASDLGLSAGPPEAK